MKHFLLISTAVLILVNFLGKLIFINYDWFNFGLSSIILLHTALILYLLSSAKIADGFRVSLYVIFSALGILMFIMSQFSPSDLRNNWIIMLLLATCAIQWVVFLLVKAVKRIVKD